MKRTGWEQDRGLNELVLLANAHDVGVRLGSEESSFVPSRRRRGRGWRGWIEVHVNWTTFAAVDISAAKIRTIAAKALAHELGHLLIAPLGRRYRKDYGIPVGTRSVAAHSRWELDEAKARLVENYLLKEYGFSTRMRLLKDPIASYRKATDFRRHLRKKAWQWWREEGEEYIVKELS